MKLNVPIKTIDYLSPSVMGKLQRKLAGTPQEMWERKTFRQDGTKTQKDTQSIILCWSGFATAKREEFRRDAFKTEQWTQEFDFFKEELNSVNELIAKKYPGGTLRSMLTRLKPDGYISPHKDIDPTFTYSHRLHLGIVTNSEVDFFVDGETYNIKEGELIEFDNLRKHSVHNRSNLARIHLIVDVLKV